MEQWLWKEAEDRGVVVAASRVDVVVMGMVNIMASLFHLGAQTWTNGPCAASGYINPHFSCFLFLGHSPIIPLY
jgi:hypothetical protein